MSQKLSNFGKAGGDLHLASKGATEKTKDRGRNDRQTPRLLFTLEYCSILVNDLKKAALGTKGSKGPQRKW